jgi:NADPH-dependent 2,4-dienoyl-CoA reductase/sulfur reductase-like enzyme
MGRRVVVVGGGLVGLELATFLAERGRHVTVVDDAAQMGLPMALPRRWRAVRHAADLGVDLRRSTAVHGLVDGGVRIGPADPDTPAELVAGEDIAADDVVVATGVQADTDLSRMVALRLADTDVEVRVVGDAAGVGYIEGAIRSGHDVAMSL